MRDKEAEISIIVPAFNEEKNISRCFDSIIGQTFTDIEVIFVDDGSTDKTFEIASDYSSKDSRIKCFRNTGKGVSDARNFGIKNASGKYIGFADSDDYIQPQMYEFLYRAVSKNNCDMAVCGYERVRGKDIKSFEYTARECTCDEFISFGNNNYVLDNEMKVSSVCCKLINADLLSEDIKFEKFVLGEDTVFCAKLWTKADKVILVDLPLYAYCINSESITHISYSDKRWLDLIKTRFMAYEEYLNYKNKKIAYFYFEKGISQINYYRYFSKNTENEKFYKTETKKFYKKYIKDYLKCSFISVKSKVMFLIFYYFPFAYRIFRKKYYND